MCPFGPIPGKIKMVGKVIKIKIKKNERNPRIYFWLVDDKATFKEKQNVENKKKAGQMLE